MTTYRLILLGAVALIWLLNGLVAWERRRNPRFAAGLDRARSERRAEERRPLGPGSRLFFGITAACCGAVAVLAFLFLLDAPDFALFILLFLVPSAYIALAFGYLALTGKKSSFPDASMFWLWPW